MDVFVLEGWIGIVVEFVLLAVTIFAFVNALLFKPAAYEAAGKLTKSGWLIILGVALALEILPVGVGFLRLLAIVPPLVYLTDVRPALSGLRRR